MSQIHKLLIRNGPPIFYASSHGDEPTLADLYDTYCAQCRGMSLEVSHAGFQGWLLFNSGLKYAGTGEHNFLSLVDEFIIPEH